MPILGIIASAFRSAAGPQGAYDALASVTVPSGGAASISFTGIPSGYKHLQIRGITRGTGNSAEWFLVNLNGTASVRSHMLYGQGSSAASTSGANGLLGLPVVQTSAGAGIFGAFIVDVLDYASTNKTKTIRSLSGKNQNGYGTNYLGLGSSLYNSTDSVTSLTITPELASFAQHSHFALYGVK